jgi:hypothetical protein
MIPARQQQCLEYLQRVGRASPRRLRTAGFAERTADALVRAGLVRYRNALSRGLTVRVYEIDDHAYRERAS